MQFNTVSDVEQYIESKYQQAGMQTSNVCLYKTYFEDQVNIISFDGPEGTLEPDVKVNELNSLLNSTRCIFKVSELLAIKNWIENFSFRVPVI